MSSLVRKKALLDHSHFKKMKKLDGLLLDCLLYAGLIHFELK